MAKRRYHQSMRDRMDESMGERKYLNHERNMHNDEMRTDKEPYGAGPYHYDREERSMYRRMGGAEYYAGMEPRRRQEMRDAGMIHEDPYSVANLPQDVRYHAYPKVRNGLPEELDDTINGIDRQIEYDHGHAMKHFYPKKV
jgi:hypothetical protein